MKKFILLILLITLQGLFNKTYTYDYYYGQYHYEDLNSDKKIKVSEDEEILFILDFSSSMEQKMGYTTKSFLAIDAIREILNELGAETKIGLRIFGITDKNGLEIRRGKLYINKDVVCSASTLVSPIARYNSENISDKLSKFVPQGMTPIGYALREAVQNDFSPNAKLKHIILVTDGIENCGDDPCLYIKNLMTLRDDFKIDVIGITISENLYSKLKCISDAGKGNYYSVDTPTDFKIKFTQAIKSTWQDSNKPIPTTPNIPSAKVDNTKYKNYTFQFYN